MAYLLMELGVRPPSVSVPSFKRTACAALRGGADERRVRAAPGPPAELRWDGELQELRQLVRERGGWTTPHLRLQDPAPSSGVRGLVATRDLAPGSPILVAPPSLFISATSAAEAINAHLDSPRAGLLQDKEALALYLALERSAAAQGASPLRAYLALLPHEPSTPWRDWQGGCEDPAALAASVPRELAGRMDEKGWAAAVEAHRDGVEARLKRMAAVCRKRAHVARGDMLWGLEMVMSRAFRPWPGAEAALIPYLDLLNHSDARAADGAPDPASRRESATRPAPLAKLLGEPEEVANAIRAARGVGCTEAADAADAAQASGPVFALTIQRTAADVSTAGLRAGEEAIYDYGDWRSREANDDDRERAARFLACGF
ncbi:unnamed protein product [Pedinophyceae sp. YPF-701]|nr:unnamed protein product [Pedinophyceae sp. YPF-701]